MFKQNMSCYKSTPPSAAPLLPGVPAVRVRDVTMDISNVQFGWLWRKCADTEKTILLALQLSCRLWVVFDTRHPQMKPSLTEVLVL